jgi:hypothetical protein
MYIFGNVIPNDDAPRMLPYRASIMVGVCSHSHTPGTDPLNTFASDDSSRVSISRPLTTSMATGSGRSDAAMTLPVTTTRSSTCMDRDALSADAVRSGASAT